MLARSPLKLALLATASAALVLTSGCAGRGNKAKDTAFVARDVDTLYMAAKDRLTRDSGLRLSYWCDRRAAEATSPSAMAGALVRLHSAIGRASGRLSVWGSRDEAGLWPLLRSLSEPPSSTELTRWERAARLRTTFDPRGQHPPIGHRIAVLEASPLPAQQVSLLSIGADHELVEPVAQLARLMVRGG